jgi:Fur family transcriptional regulator, ferric uptake regulator
MQHCCINLLQLCCINYFVKFAGKMKRRNTESQEAVLSILSGSRKAMSQHAIENKMVVEADRVTVYRILNRFVEDGIVHKIVADDGKQYFAVCVKCDDKKKLPDNHFHFRCTVCETIQCMPTLVNFSVPRGYKVEKLNCVLVGVCKDCA